MTEIAQRGTRIAIRGARIVQRVPEDSTARIGIPVRAVLFSLEDSVTWRARRW